MPTFAADTGNAPERFREGTVLLAIGTRPKECPMTKRSLLISATIAAIAIASGNALAQSEGGMPPAELSPPAAGGGGAAPSADPGAANPGAGNAGLERGDRGSDAAMPGENRAGGRDWAGSKGDPDKVMQPPPSAMPRP